MKIFQGKVTYTASTGFSSVPQKWTSHDPDQSAMEVIKWQVQNETEETECIVYSPLLILA